MSSAFNIPAGWKIDRQPTGELIINGPHVGVVVRADATEPRMIPEEVLFMLASALLAVTPPVDAVPGEPVALDGCELCNGRRGGVPGNENIIDGKRVCDYCHSASVASQAGSEPVATVTALDSLKREALEIFDGTETSQDVRDVIEWYSASIRVILDKARSRINAALSAPAAAAEAVAWEVMTLGEWRPTRFPDELRAKGYQVRIALPDRERAASLVASEDTKRLDWEHELIAAAQAVIERWDTPLWKDAPHTAIFINRMREAIDAARAGEA
jgi:hypothetical protein